MWITRRSKQKVLQKGSKFRQDIDPRQKRELSFLPSASHYHLKLENLEIPELALSLDLQLIPRDIVYLAGIIIDKMMVLFDIGIEDNGAFLDRLHSDKSFLDKKVQRVVYRGSRDGRALLPSGRQDIVGSWVCLVLQYAFNNRNPLGGGLNIAMLQDRDSVFHLLRISIELDDVKNPIHIPGASPNLEIERKFA
jgi:hypothetical protein